MNIARYATPATAVSHYMSSSSYGDPLAKTNWKEQRPTTQSTTQRRSSNSTERVRNSTSQHVVSQQNDSYVFARISNEESSPSENKMVVADAVERLTRPPSSGVTRTKSAGRSGFKASPMTVTAASQQQPAKRKPSPVNWSMNLDMNSAKQLPYSQLQEAQQSSSSYNVAHQSSQSHAKQIVVAQRQTHNSTKLLNNNFLELSSTQKQSEQQLQAKQINNWSDDLDQFHRFKYTVTTRSKKQMNTTTNAVGIKGKDPSNISLASTAIAVKAFPVNTQQQEKENERKVLLANQTPTSRPIQQQFKTQITKRTDSRQRIRRSYDKSRQQQSQHLDSESKEAPGSVVIQQQQAIDVIQPRQRRSFTHNDGHEDIEDALLGSGQNSRSNRGSNSIARCGNNGVGNLQNYIRSVYNPSTSSQQYKHITQGTPSSMSTPMETTSAVQSFMLATTAQTRELTCTNDPVESNSFSRSGGGGGGQGLIVKRKNAITAAASVGERDVEQIHFVSVEFQQNCKKWLGQIENS